MNIMIKNIFSIILLTGALMFLNSCEDPEDSFSPKNPDLAVDAVVGTANSAQSVLVGANRQLSRAMNEFVVISEITSDNYVNTATFFNQFLDGLNVDATDDDIDDTQFEIHRLRELATTGRDVIAPADEGSTAEQIAEFNFLIGMSHLLFGENFKSIPGEPGGPVLDAATHLAEANKSFQTAISGTSNSDLIAACNLGAARASYRLGNKSDAVAFANAAIGLDPTFIKFAEFDAANGPANTMQNALYDRGTFDDLQPLPRLDFLDPKYNGTDVTTDINIPLLKIEEAHLILIEAAISNSDLPGAQQIMKDLIALVATRPTATFNDSAEGRTQDAPGSRPDSTNAMIAASDSDPLRAGLVLDRNSGNVTVPTVSGTSVTDAMVDMVGSEDEALELLYLMRQEIFIAEGRRMADLGIRFVVSDVEFRSNDNVATSDLEPIIPDFIGTFGGDIDGFNYDVMTGEATILHNLNKVLVQKYFI